MCQHIILLQIAEEELLKNIFKYIRKKLNYVKHSTKHWWFNN
jgi:hypothetical protein